MNGTLVKNQLIFDYASGSLGFSKSVFASTYLYLNSKASNINSTFEAMLGEDLLNNDNIPVTKLKYTDCLKNEKMIQMRTILMSALYLSLLVH